MFDPVTFLFSTANRARDEPPLGRRGGDRLAVARQAAAVGQLRLSERDAAGRGGSRRQVHELRRPKHSGSLALDGASGRLTYGASIAYVGTHFDQRDTFPFDRGPLGSYWLADARARLCGHAGRRAVRSRRPTCSSQRYQDVFGYRTEPRGRLRRSQAGGSAIIAVKLASAASLPSTLARPANLHTLARFWTNSTSSLSSTPGSTGCAELRALDGHEIDQLAGAGEAERLDRENAGRLRQRLDDQHAGHDRAPREMALEERLVDRHRLDRGDPLVRIEALRPGRRAASGSDAAAPPSPA